ncbi:MAG: DUF3014 domain-containing protein [Vicinamibacteria bacterium]|nr:DUF3014 domain-containing protein [Vicinamibacteria bacterium]
MNDLDDLDLRPRDKRPDEFDETFDPATEAAPPRPESGIHPAIPVITLVVFLVGGYFAFRSGAPAISPTPAVTPTPIPAASVAAAPIQPRLDLPALNASDAVVRSLVAALSANRDFAKWLLPEQLVRKFVAAVDNIAEDEDPSAHIRHLAPPAGFQAMGPRTALVADPKSYRRFDSFASVVASIDATAAARLFLNLGPLFDDAYAELGHPKGEFDQTFSRALARLLATPPSPRRFELVRQKASFGFADPKLEALASAQKMLIRMGPDNRAKVQSKLEELRNALEAARRGDAGVSPPT